MQYKGGFVDGLEDGQGVQIDKTVTASKASSNKERKMALLWKQIKTER